MLFLPKVITRSFLLLTLLGCAGQLFAFDENGHNMVAQLMVPFLNDGARAELQRLYGDDWQREVVALASREQSELNRPKFRHLQARQLTLFNGGDTEFDAARHCPANQCSVAAILESRQVLMRTNYVDSDKRQALNYLMHYMVQLHIPINCGLTRDMGGQKIYLKDADLNPVNLAWIWNYDLYRKLNERWFTLAQKLYRQIQDEQPEQWLESMAPQDWALESHQLAVEQLYPLAAEGRYSAQLIKSGQEILQQQLKKAAYRTAALLNEVYGDGLSLEE